MIDNNVKVYRRLGNTPDGKVLYEIREDDTKKYKKITVPEENADKYEKLCDSLDNTSLKNFTTSKFKRKVEISSVMGAVFGAGISLLFSKNKKVLSVIAGTLLGCLTGAIGYIAYFANKFHNVISEAKKLGIEDYKES